MRSNTIIMPQTIFSICIMFACEQTASAFFPISPKLEFLHSRSSSWTGSHLPVFSSSRGNSDEEADANDSSIEKSSNKMNRSYDRMGMLGENENEDTMNDDTDVSIPCLPPIGESSFKGDRTDQNSEKSHFNVSSDGCSVGLDRFEIQYTCNICETRNSHKVSRMAYRNGIVIAVCKGCMSKHLIADNLGWTKYLGGFNGDKNIEEFMETIGRKDEVNRVSQEIFDLEMLMTQDNDVGRRNDRSDPNFFE